MPNDELVKREERVELAVPDAAPLLAFSDAMAKSRMFPNFTDKWQVAAAIQLGIDMGIKPMVALQTMSIVNGRVCVEAKILQAQLERAGVKITIIESTDKVAKVKFKKTGKDPYTETFTIEDAQKKGLLAKNNWKFWPGEMLYWRCISRGGRKYDPAAIFNLYLPDEMEEVNAKPVGKTLSVKGGKVEEVKAEPVPKPEPAPEPEEEEAIDAEVVEEEEEKPEPPKPKPRAKKKATPKPKPEPTPQEEPKHEETPQEKSKEPEKETTEAEDEKEPPAQPGIDYVAQLQADLKVRWGNKYEDQYRLLKVFLSDFQEQREPKRHFVGRNEFGNLSFTVGKSSDHQLLAENTRAWMFTLDSFSAWKKELGIKTMKELKEKLEKEGGEELPF